MPTWSKRRVCDMGSILHPSPQPAPNLRDRLAPAGVFSRQPYLLRPARRPGGAETRRLDLIDEFRLDLYPYVAGEATRLFDDVPKSYRLDLVSCTAFSNGPSGCSTVGTANPAARQSARRLWWLCQRLCHRRNGLRPRSRCSGIQYASGGCRKTSAL